MLKEAFVYDFVINNQTTIDSQMDLLLVLQLRPCFHIVLRQSFKCSSVFVFLFAVLVTVDGCLY